MIDLMQRNEYDQLEELVKSLVTAGWRFPGLIWNIYVKFLAVGGYTELAFKYCEQYLIGGFEGWPGIMQADVSPKARLERPILGSPVSRVMKPTYEVLCWLAKSYIDFRKKHAFSLQRSEQVAKLWEIAPKSLDAVTYMPRVNDITQGRILRGEKREKEGNKHKPFR